MYRITIIYSIQYIYNEALLSYCLTCIVELLNKYFIKKKKKKCVPNLIQRDFYVFHCISV